MKRAGALGAWCAAAVVTVSACGSDASNGPIDGTWQVISVAHGTSPAVNTSAVKTNVSVNGSTVDGDDGLNVHHSTYSYDDARVSVKAGSVSAVGRSRTSAAERDVIDAFTVLFDDGSFTYRRDGDDITVTHGDTTVKLAPARHS